MAIPKLIHQTWKDERVPPSMRAFAESWKINHPGWEYHLWTDTQNREFIRTHFPDFLTRYDSYPYHIQRVDAVRYFQLYTLGGLYVDLDFKCIRSLAQLLSEYECLFGLEPDEHCKNHGRERIICNALMATVPKHALFKAIIDELATCDPPYNDRNNAVLETTGPFMLTRVYNRCRPEDVTLLPSQLLYPLSLSEVERTFQNGWGEAEHMKLRNAYAVHYFAGTWWK
jgi:mannosyltransferase OCH1-like enzyme